MTGEEPQESDFLTQIIAVIGTNIANEQFGVTELADAMNMSRSNLLRKVKKETNKPVNQLIREVRLTRGMELLKQGSLNVSEVSRQVGFNSTSYFIKCFREHYGYPPGEVGKRSPDEPEVIVVSTNPNRKRNLILAGGLVAVVALTFAVIFYSDSFAPARPQEKSIAVLPFKNDSNDSTNVYLINGLMESTLNNLQLIKDLKVISRTSSEKYRSTSKSIPEMAKELNVNYFIEGSGQKIGDQILLNIQLIDGRTDRHLWAKQYKREVKDIFALQQEIARNIASEIEAVMTPEEQQQLSKKATDDPVAYDLYLKGKDLLYQSTNGSLNKSIPYFDSAIARDPKFALAYANAVVAFFYLDLFQVKKEHGEQIASYSDKALLYDPKLDESLVAKALYYMHESQFASAIPYFEKALENDPGNGLVLNFLCDFYNTHSPNPTKYLEYALRASKIDIVANDSGTVSHKYLHLSNALIQNGFVDEALTYVNRSLAYGPNNTNSMWVKVLIVYMKDHDLSKSRDLLMFAFNKDRNQFHLLEEIGKIYFFMGEYDSAYSYYRRFLDIRERMNLDLFTNADLEIAMAFEKLGRNKEAKQYVASYKAWAENDKTMYRDLMMSSYYSYMKDTKQALEHLRAFSKLDNFQTQVLLVGEHPSSEAIRDLPEFKEIMKVIIDKFDAKHARLKVMLEEEGLP